MDIKKKLRIFQALSALLAVSLIVIVHNQLDSEFTYTRLSKKTMLSSSVKISGDPEEWGELVCTKTCQDKYMDYRKVKDRDFFHSINNQSHAFFIGIDKFMEFADYLEDLKNDTIPPQGVRIFNCITTRLDSAGRTVKYYDTFIAPQKKAALKTMRNGEDVPLPFKLIESVTDYGLALNSSWPCPDKCSVPPLSLKEYPDLIDFLGTE